VAIELARRSARVGEVKNVRFIQADVKKTAEALVKEGARFDLLLADPPRTGAPGIAAWARGLGVRRLVYVACDPAALARDAGELRRAGYRPIALQLLDMFPQTHHVEAVMSFEQEGG
jgi:23S rRNA (uracil1939-C5)-methyltransferase